MAELSDAVNSIQPVEMPVKIRLLVMSCILALPLTFRVCVAQAPPTVDLEISAELAPSGQLVPGITARLVLRFRNNGPDVAPRAAAVSSTYNYGVGQQFALIPSAPNPCPVAFDDFTGPPGTPIRLRAIVTAGAVGPGGEAVCTFDVPISVGARGQTSLSFMVGDASVVINDPIEANNSVVLGLVFDPPLEVPALGAVLQMLLVALLGGFAVFRQRTQHLA